MNCCCCCCCARSTFKSWPMQNLLHQGKEHGIDSAPRAGNKIYFETSPKMMPSPYSIQVCQIIAIYLRFCWILFTCWGVDGFCLRHVAPWDLCWKLFRLSHVYCQLSGACWRPQWRRGKSVQGIVEEGGQKHTSGLDLRFLYVFVLSLTVSVEGC